MPLRRKTPCAKRVETVDNPPFDWNKTLEAVKTRLGAEVVDRWLAPLSVATASDRLLVLEAPNVFFRDWVVAHYLDEVRSHVHGRVVEIAATASIVESRGASQLEPQRFPNEARPEPRAPGGAGWSSALNVKFTFERFVVGASNRFAHAASLAVAESPARAYNPLFIYGGVGLGKTHLMQAIGQAILRRWAAQRVVYTSSERFTNELITAIQNKTTAKFRDRYRTVDVLLVDDIHFIAEKEATQEEFFHTFNALYDAHKQIIISSDRSPKEISGLEERLVSRFEWGLVTDIQPPDLETRTAILRKKAEESGVEVPAEVTDFIAQQITSNIRELEGALIRVVAYCTLFSIPQSAGVAKEVLKDMVREVSARITVSMVQRVASEFFAVAIPELCGAKRERSVLYPRQVAMYLCRKLTEASLPEIGRAFGGRDHTTVLHAVGKIDRELTQDINKKSVVERLQTLVLSAAQHPK